MLVLWGLFIASAGSILGSLFYVFSLNPELSQGFVQKIFFFHVPAALSMYAALFGGASLSTYFLFDRKKIIDEWAQALIYTATFLASLVIISGPIWARPIWGVWWTWDPRLTTTFVVFILLLGYCFARSILSADPRSRMKAPVVSAVLALLALLDAPLIHFSVTLWRGIHPSVLRNPAGLPPSYRSALEWMFLGVLLFAALIANLFFYWIHFRNLQEEILEQTARRNENA